MQRADAAETDPWQIEIERRPGELHRRPQPDQEAGNAPEHREHSRDLDRGEIVVRPAVDFLRRRIGRAVEVVIEGAEHHGDARRRGEEAVEREGRILRLGGAYEREKRQRGEADQHREFALGHRLARSDLSHVRSPSVRMDSLFDF